MLLITKHLFRYPGAAFCFLIFVAGKSFSQTDRSASNIEHELVAIFEEVSHRASVPVDAPCAIPANLPIENLLHKALVYNRQGYWQCSKAVLQSVFENRLELSPLQACHVHLALAEYYSFHQSLDSVLLYGNVANREAGENKWGNEKAQALLLLSTAGLKRRNISAAYLMADSALITARQANNTVLEGRVLLQLALCARRHFTSIARRSFPYYLIAREKAILGADTVTLAVIDLYLGMDNFELNNYSEGLSYLKEGIMLSMNSNDLDLRCRAYSALGYALPSNHSDQSLWLFNNALHLSQKLQQPYTTQVTYHQLADRWLALKQYDSALLYADLSGNVAGIDSFWANVWDLKASIYHDMGRYKMAAAMYQKSLQWFNEDFLYRNQNQLSEYEAKLKTKERELEVAQQKKRALQLEWTISAVGGLLVVSGLAIAMQRKAQRKLTMQNALIQKQRSDLEQSLGEKEILLKEIHHRVKNNLAVISSLLELQSNGIENETAKAAIAVGQNRVSSIALIHQRLYQHENLEAIELNAFLHDLFRQVSSIFKKPDSVVKFENNVPETLLDIDTAVPLSLIINELLTNSYKYAFSTGREGIIKIDLQQKISGEFILTYADNGPGIDSRINTKNTASLGLRLINRLSKQLAGSATYRYFDGSTFAIQFKDSHTRNQEG